MDMNLIELQENLKALPINDVMRMANAPSTPMEALAAIGEISRRNQMRQAALAGQSGPQGTTADAVKAGASVGGPQAAMPSPMQGGAMPNAMAAQMPMGGGQPTPQAGAQSPMAGGIGGLAPAQPQGYKDGGLVEPKRSSSRSASGDPIQAVLDLPEASSDERELPHREDTKPYMVLGRDKPKSDPRRGLPLSSLVTSAIAGADTKTVDDVSGRPGRGPDSADPKEVRDWELERAGMKRKPPAGYGDPSPERQNTAPRMHFANGGRVPVPPWFIQDNEGPDLDGNGLPTVDINLDVDPLKAPQGHGGGGGSYRRVSPMDSAGIEALLNQSNPLSLQDAASDVSGIYGEDPYAELRAALAQRESDNAALGKKEGYTALLELGSKLMSGRSPNFLSNLGDASSAGVAALTKARATQDARAQALLNNKADLAQGRDRRQSAIAGQATNLYTQNQSLLQRAAEAGLDAALKMKDQEITKNKNASDAAQENEKIKILQRQVAIQEQKADSLGLFSGTLGPAGTQYMKYLKSVYDKVRPGFNTRDGLRQWQARIKAGDQAAIQERDLIQEYLQAMATLGGHAEGATPELEAAAGVAGGVAGLAPSGAPIASGGGGGGGGGGGAWNRGNVDPGKIQYNLVGNKDGLNVYDYDPEGPGLDHQSSGYGDGTYNH